VPDAFDAHRGELDLAIEVLARDHFTQGDPQAEHEL